MSDSSSAPPLRVLYVVSLFPCLSETFLAREMNALVGHGTDLCVLSLKSPAEMPAQEHDSPLLRRTRHPAGPVRSIMALLGLAVQHPLKVGGFVAKMCSRMWRQPKNLLLSIGALCQAAGQWRAIREFNPQIIHAAWATYPATVAWFLSHMLDRPYSYTSRAHDIFVEDQMIADKLASAALAITITRHNVRHLARWMPGDKARPLHVIHSALDLPNNPYSRERRLPHRLLSVGRLDPIKGYDVLLDAMAELKRRGVVFESIVIGEGKLRPELEAKREALGLGDQVQFIGARPNAFVRQAMAEATLMVLPCVVTPEGNADGIPNVLTESMAAGLPVVSTRASGIPELIDDGISGRLVAPNDPLALADAVAGLLADPDLREAFAVAGRQKVEREFDVIKESGRLLSHMREVVRGSGAYGPNAHTDGASTESPEALREPAMNTQTRAQEPVR